jgi:aspartyl-tRNA(Asn)/glutamyl-tRNA(Gln) amidotransferase subunit A
MINLEKLTIKKAQELIRRGEISCRELVSIYQENIKNKNRDINAFLEVFKDAFETAEQEDKEILKGGELKPLTGIPVAIKDNILIEGKISSAGSKILEKYHATYDSTVVKKLKEAGAIILGRTNMDEFAMGSSTENSAYGVVLNPYDLERVAGGSSGGSAAAVAMQGALAALGSDTGGSIRQPAAFCGVVGLKPTYGAVSRYGLIAMASSLDQIGPLAKTTEDAEIVFDVIKGWDPKDSTSVKIQNSKIKTQNLRIGLLKYDRKGIDEKINDAIIKSIDILRRFGHGVKEVELPNLKYSLACYYIIMPAEVSANLARFDGIRYGLSVSGENLLEDYMKTRAEGFGRETKRRIMLGTYVLSAGYYDEYYGRAQKVRALIKRDFQEVFKEVDVLLSPTTPTSAFKAGEKVDNPLAMYLSDIFTVSVNLAGLPAISIPATNPDFVVNRELPIGIQFIAPWFGEDLLFYLAKQYEHGSRS